MVDEYNSNYRHSVGKNPVDADYSALTKETETNAKAPQFKVDDRVRFTLNQRFTLKICHENHLLLILC